jgi:hypothetical protein
MAPPHRGISRFKIACVARRIEKRMCFAVAREPRFKAMDSYAAGVSAISSGKPRAERRLVPTRPAKLDPVSVTTGTPAHSASHVVACAL